MYHLNYSDLVLKYKSSESRQMFTSSDHYRPHGVPDIII